VKEDAQEQARNVENALTETTILVAGESHTAALFGQAFPEALAGTEIRLVSICGGRMCGLLGPWPRSQEYWDEVIRLSPRRTVVLAIGGNEHNSLFLLASGTPFDFVSSDFSDQPIQDNVLIIPERLVRMRFDRAQSCYNAFMIELSRSGASKVVVLGSPPPKNNDDELRRLIQNEYYFSSRIRTPYNHLQFTPPPIRLKLWSAVQDSLAELASRHGAAFLSAPASASDEEGFLKPEFWAQDATHANSVYGALMLTNIEQFLKLHLDRSELD
jgi:hypothetical protein